MESRLEAMESRLSRQISLVRSLLTALSVFVLIVLGVISRLSTESFLILMGFWAATFFGIAAFYEFMDRREKKRPAGKEEPILKAGAGLYAQPKEGLEKTSAQEQGPETAARVQEQAPWPRREQGADYPSQIREQEAALPEREGQNP